MTLDRLDDWHRLFGLTLTDVFSDTSWRVELEKDLAQHPAGRGRRGGRVPW
ncbi:MAG: hypothetical protein R6X17_00170 [Candidatus Competibacteraceae bacterium]